ncbi:UNVERIFIED_CONTAM: hypothetical protein FKN15_060759 [Acipenser sinensis]
MIQKCLLVIEVFPLFLDTQGLIEQDFVMMFSDEASVRFLEAAYSLQRKGH